MATIDSLIESVDGLQDSVTELTTEVNFKKASLTEAVTSTGEDRTATGLDRIATGEDRAQTGEDRVQTGLDRTATEQAKDIAVTKASEANTSAINSQEAFTNTQSLLVNFFDPEIIALNLRGIAEGASFEIKLRHVQDDLDLLDQYGFSLVTIPSVTKAGKLYSVVPEDGSGDFTVSRNGTATRTNAQGFIETVHANVPRLDYDAVTGEFKGVLVEPAATNLLSNNIDFQGWAYTGTFGILNSTIAPDGTLTATKVIGILNNTSQKRLDILNLSNNGNIHNYSFYAKSGELKHINLRLDGGAESIFTVNLETGQHSVADNTVLLNYSVIYVGNGWYRISASKSPNTVANLRINLGKLGNSSIESFEGDGVSGLYIWGNQFETGSIATSLIITYDNTVTRPADLITKTNAQDLIGQTEGSFFVEFSLLHIKSNDVIFAITDGTANNRLRILTTNTSAIRVLFQLNGNVVQFDLQSVSFLNGLRNKILVNYKNGNISIFTNGNKIIQSSNSLTISSILNTVFIGGDNVGTVVPANIRTSAISKNIISDAQAIQLTTI